MHCSIHFVVLAFSLQTSACLGHVGWSQDSHLASSPDHVRQWLRDQHEWRSTWRMGGRAIEVGVTQVTSSLISLSEAQRRFEAVERLVDHPDRSLMESLLPIARKPARTQYRVVYGGSDLWRCDRSTSEYRLLAAGSSSDRWMLYEPVAGDPSANGSQLTIIGAGIPHPALYNVSRSLDESEQLLGMFLAPGSVVVLPPDTATIQTREHSWTAAHAPEGEERRLTLQGGWMADGSPRLDKVTLQWKEQRQWIENSWVFEGYEPFDARAATVPRKVTRLLGGLLERRTYVMEHVHLHNPADMAHEVELPSAPAGAGIADFRDERSPAWSGLEDARATAVTWLPMEGVDNYVVGNDARPSQSQSNIDPAERSRFSRTLAIWLVVSVLLVPVSWLLVKKCKGT